MAAGHSVDEYLETIYFLAFPIGEYTPKGAGSPPLASRVAEMLHVSRASAGEMLKRLEAEGLIERGARKEALLTATGRVRAGRQVGEWSQDLVLLLLEVGIDRPAVGATVRVAELDIDPLDHLV